MQIHIKDVRLRYNMSINELARISGISKSHLSNIENGGKIPGLDVICKIAKALEVEPQELFSCEESGQEDT